jgi:hypothetical protein
MTPDMREGHEGFSSFNAGGECRLALKSRSGARSGPAPKAEVLWKKHRQLALGDTPKQATNKN